VKEYIEKMIITKKLETRLDISISDMYCADYNKKAIELLKTKFINRCYKSIYITDILRIVNRNTMHCKNKTLDGGVYMDISFEVSGIVYEKGEIIHNCKIIEILSKSLIAKHEQTSVIVTNINNISIFKEGEEIPVIVEEVGYKPYEHGIAVVALPFIPKINPIIVYKITSDEIVDKSDSKKFDTIVDAFDVLETKNTLGYQFFRGLIYPYKKFRKPQGTTISLGKLDGLKIGDMVYKPESYLDDDKLVFSDGKEADITIAEMGKSQFIKYILDVYQKNLIKLTGFVQLYNTAAKIKEKEEVWKFYNNFRE
jgi:hypothetical protein